MPASIEEFNKAKCMYARLAVVATHWVLHLQVARPVHIPPPAVVGGWGVATRERHGDVLGSLRL